MGDEGPRVRRPAARGDREDDQVDRRRRQRPDRVRRVREDDEVEDGAEGLARRDPEGVPAVRSGQEGQDLVREPEGGGAHAGREPGRRRADGDDPGGGRGPRRRGVVRGVQERDAADEGQVNRLGTYALRLHAPAPVWLLGAVLTSRQLLQSPSDLPACTSLRLPSRPVEPVPWPRPGCWRTPSEDTDE